MEIVTVKANISCSLVMPDGSDKVIAKNGIYTLPEQFGRGSYISNKVFTLLPNEESKKKEAQVVEKKQIVETTELPGPKKKENSSVEIISKPPKGRGRGRNSGSRRNIRKNQ